MYGQAEEEATHSLLWPTEDYHHITTESSVFFVWRASKGAGGERWTGMIIIIIRGRGAFSEFVPRNVHFYLF